jgi:hypothetical protein
VKAQYDPGNFFCFQQSLLGHDPESGTPET